MAVASLRAIVALFLLTTRQQDVRLIGRSEAMRVLEGEVNAAARSTAKILITGETGVGKEVVARLIHQRSARVSAPFVTVNCAGLPDSLLESELFGHVRGSFTGAFRDKPGLLETAPNGTVFLDEVGEMTPRMQVVLLRFLETGEMQRVGAERSHTCPDVRLITATNRDLDAQIASGDFRQDLYFRLNVIRLHIPPLRERRGDIPPLVEYYLNGYSRRHSVPMRAVSPDAMEALVAYRWPGNVRELKNVIERIVLTSVGPTIRVKDLPAEVGHSTQSRVQALLAPASADRERGSAETDGLLSRMLDDSEPFWSAVFPQFMVRDLTRRDLRAIIRSGLERTNGNYRQLVRLFNMRPEDYKRFLNFLRKHDCHLPYQRFRTAPRLRLQAPVETVADVPPPAESIAEATV